VTTKLLAVMGAGLEAATGVIVIADPGFVIRLLIGAHLSSGGIAVGRVCGMGLLSLGLACWPGRKTVTAQATAALFTYNLLSSVYIGYLGGSGEFAAYLLWPACFLHGFLAFLLAGLAYEAVRREWLGVHPRGQIAGV